MGLHQISQKNLPLLVYAAGQPLILGLAGKSKSYAERLFVFPKVGVLDDADARRAITVPMKANGIALRPEALAEIPLRTGRYPDFLQQWGYETWNTGRKLPRHIDRRNCSKSTRYYAA